MNRQKLMTVAVVVAVLAGFLAMGGSLQAQTTAPVINEFVFNHTGSDTAAFIEVFGAANTDYGAYTVLEIEGDSGPGAIDAVLPVGTTDGNGFWVSPEDVENGTVTLLLVEGFSGSAGDDIDTDDDGVMDVMPWTAVVDSVAVTDGGSSDQTYSSVTLAPGFDGNSFTVGGASRIPNGTDTDSVSDWVRNAFNGAGLPGFSGTPEAGEAWNTPGAVNEVAGPALPNVVINEIMQNPAAVYDSAGEWFELYNAGSGDVDVDGWTIADDGSDSHVINNGGPLVIPAGGYLVLGNNADSGTNGGVPVAYSYGGSWYLANGADEVVLLDAELNEVDRVAYDGGPLFPDPNGASMSLTDPALDNNDGANWCESTTPYGAGDLGTPGGANTCAPSGPVAAKIHEVQGSGSSVAITTPVIVEAVVVGDYQAGDQLRGFFIQEEDSDVDANAETSEGIFVYCGGCATDVAVGDLVEVTGEPGEYFGMSQIGATAGDEVVVVSSGNALPTAATIDLPASGSTEAEATFEAVEGMLVTFSDTLVVSEYFELARYGQLVLTAEERPRQFTDAYEPSVEGYAAYLEWLNSRRIILDDDNNIQNDAIEVGPDEPYFWPRPGLSITNYVRGGDSIEGLTGVLHWSYAGQSGTDAWRVRPVETLDYTFSSNNPRPAAPEDVGGSLKVASFNVLNYFTTLDSRGADSLHELDRQREKIAAAICTMDADIVGLMEIENNGGTAALDLLNGANGINENCGPYAYVDTGVIGTDQIAQAFIYRPATVSLMGEYAVLDGDVDPRFRDDYNRPALAQTFMEDATGGIVTVVVNHLKSKGSACSDIGDPDLGDGQGNCNLTRQQAAEAMVDWLATDPTGSGDGDVLIIGDLNSYRNEDPIDAIEEGADDVAGTDDDYVDLLDALIGPSAYSYVFDGQLGYLDYALANEALLDAVTGVTVWHINADEMPVFDYNDAILDEGERSFERESDALDIYEPDAYRASDHDPVIVGLDLCDEIAPTLSVSVSPEMLWPPNHKYVDVTATVMVDDNFDPNPTVELVSVTSNEPDNGEDDGDTVDDIVIVDDTLFMLRAERSGVGSGRVYTITYVATDACGNSTMASAEVWVPLSQ